MFKRVERKRKRREEWEEIDDDTKEMMGLNDTDSDDSNSDSEQESAQSYSNQADPGIGEDEDQGESPAISDSGDEGGGGDPPISVEEVLRDPVYLISLDPTAHGCVVCKGKLIKNAEMVNVHKNAKEHKRRFENFKRLSAEVDPRTNAWEVIRVIQSASSMQMVEPQEPSKRTLRRQAKQAAIREKRTRHKELKAKAIAKKELKKLTAAKETRPTPASEANLQYSPGSQSPPEIVRKKQRSEAKTSTSKTCDVAVESALRTTTSSDSKSVSSPRSKARGKRTSRHNLVGP